MKTRTLPQGYAEARLTTLLFRTRYLIVDRTGHPIAGNVNPRTPVGSVLRQAAITQLARRHSTCD